MQYVRLLNTSFPIHRTNLRFLSLKSSRNIWFILLLIISSCNLESKKEEAKFKDVLFKIHECEAYNELKFSNQDSVFLNSCIQSAFNESGIKAEDFYKNVEKYKRNSAEFEKLYDSLIYRSESKTIN